MKTTLNFLLVIVMLSLPGWSVAQNEQLIKEVLVRKSDFLKEVQKSVDALLGTKGKITSHCCVIQVYEQYNWYFESDDFTCKYVKQNATNNSTSFSVFKEKKGGYIYTTFSFENDVISSIDCVSSTIDKDQYGLEISEKELLVLKNALEPFLVANVSKHLVYGGVVVFFEEGKAFVLKSDFPKKDWNVVSHNLYKGWWDYLEYLPSKVKLYCREDYDNQNKIWISMMEVEGELLLVKNWEEAFKKLNP